MNNFSYSVVRSFNQYINGSANGFVTGTDERMILNWMPGNSELDRDTVCVQFYDQQMREFAGRYAGSRGKAREGDFAVQIDVFSPPNAAGEPRQAACRKLKDRVEEVFKAKVRIPLIEWDGTGGTTTGGNMFVRQTDAAYLPDPSMAGWSRWALTFRVRAIDYEV